LANDRKNQIIKAAAKRFARHGLNKTTLEEVARDIRIGKATIYHYFESKDELYLEVLKWETNLFIEQVKTIFANEQNTVQAKLLEYFAVKENLNESYKNLYEMLLNFFNDRATEQELELIKIHLSKEEDILKPLLNTSKNKKNEILPDDIAAFFVTYSWGIIFGIKLYKTKNQTIGNLFNDLIARSFETILN